ncbi:MAG TPA: gephyrin-like molybdotransferase Glp [Solirubrobacteraceae bacterium]|jgi:molybdopterin molybdotransferase|nr:gephyrin-like molybdotransferase Glp [Solirubrobacteraceae bacterium]
MAASPPIARSEHAGMLELDDARALVLAAAGLLADEPVELHAALGRVLAEDAIASQPVPAFDGSAMDGFAVRAADVADARPESPAVLQLIGESRAGAPAQERLEVGQAIAISTGAMLPQGGDAVVRIEDTRVGEGRVEVLVAAPPGRDVRLAGEDIAAGATVLKRGTALGPAELGVLASLGRDPVLCARRPRLALLCTGDELIRGGEKSRPGAVRDSNSLSIAALARRSGAEVANVAAVSDDAEQTTAAIATAVSGADVAVICGGVSVGAHDHVRRGLSALGASEVFWGLALKPGHPTWFGTLDGTLVFGLPGNPVSAMVTFVLLVQPALRSMLGLAPSPDRLSAVMEVDYEKPRGRAHAVRARLSAQADGWHAVPTGAQGSHVLTSMLAADALVLLPSDSPGARAGERVQIEPLRGERLT